jgi:uncharacterized membrane protein YraQ (UPF0718 family)
MYYHKVTVEEVFGLILYAVVQLAIQKKAIIKILGQKKIRGNPIIGS